MKYFVTGASGFIGSKVCAELIASGHQVVGLARSEDSAKKLRDMGVEPLMGSLDDIAVLQKAAKDSDGVVHCGYIHDFSKFVECAAIDGRVITALGEALEGSNKPLVISSGVMLVNKPPGEVSTEADVGATEGFGAPRAQNEAVLLSFNARGVRGSAIRLPPTTHGDGDKGFMTQIINLHRDAKCAAYAGDGLNRWPATHVLDAAHCYVLALERGKGIYHAIAEEGVTFKDIATVMGKRLGLPVVSLSGAAAAAHYKWMAGFAVADKPASSAHTRRELTWQPTHATLLEDLETGHYFDQAVGVKH